MFAPNAARLARTSYRALMRASRDLERQAARLGAPRASDAFTEDEHASLARVVPGYMDAVRASTSLRQAVSVEFRAHSEDAEHENARLDASLLVLSTLRRRARLLANMPTSNASSATTDGVRVQVTSSLLPAQTSPSDSRFVYAYEVEITNVGADEPVQIVSREWHIEDEDGLVESVKGTGVVGQQPTLGQGESFSYTSACVMKRIRGSMRGKYIVVGQNSKRVTEASIAPFALVPPGRASTTRVDDGDDEIIDEEDEDIEALTRDSSIKQ